MTYIQENDRLSDINSAVNTSAYVLSDFKEPVDGDEMIMLNLNIQIGIPCIDILFTIFKAVGLLFRFFFLTTFS